MKKVQLLAITVTVMYILSGCTNYEKKYDKDTLIVKSDDSFVEVAVENFSDSAVTPENLTNYIDEQIEAYNGSHGKKIKRQSINTNDMGNVKLVLTYEDIESYNDFNLLECSLEDYSDVQEKELKGVFKAEDGNTVKIADFENTKNAKVLMVPQAADIVVKGHILYYNNEVSVKDGVAVTTGDDTAIIIYK